MLVKDKKIVIIKGLTLNLRVNFKKELSTSGAATTNLK